MKKISIIVLALMMAGCGSMGMHDSSGGMGYRGGSEQPSMPSPAFDPNFTG